jgi:putative nucleotidyltransferase with HDIG domain
MKETTENPVNENKTGIPALAQTKRGVPLNRRDRLYKSWRQFSAALARNHFTPWVWPVLLAFVLAAGTINDNVRAHWQEYLLGLTLILAVMLRIILQANMLRLGVKPGHSYMGDLALLSILLLSSALLTKGYQVFMSTVDLDWLQTSPDILALGAPFAAVPMLGAVCLGRRAGISLAIICCLSASILWPQSSFELAFFHLGLSLYAVHLMSQGKSSRFRLVRSGFFCSLAALPMLLGWAIMNFDSGLDGINFGLTGLPMGLLAGPLAGILATSLMPRLELCGFITDDQVRAMASLDHPAMRDLMLTAPGTYHHSLVVSSLVEAAAREIGSDYLLAKTAALYHDIGKMKKPDYFVENQGSLPNRHDKLAPSMSALILISHLKDGVDLAAKYRLSRAIQDIIIQHHGTRLISYFYHKALEAAKTAGLPEPGADNFRYPGPKPQTREAGLVMLADIVEAASRSLSNPTPARLQNLVHQQISEVFMEGQLDECELTLKDLNHIGKLFNTILSGIYHHRIDYPEDKKPNDDNSKQPAKKLSPVSGLHKDAAA